MDFTQWQTPAAVMVLVVLLVVVASAVKKYQTHMAHKRATVRRVTSAIPMIEESLEALNTLPLASELRLMLRGDVVNRLQEARKVLSSYNDIDTLIASAQKRLDDEKLHQVDEIPLVESEQERVVLFDALLRLTEYLQGGGPIEHFSTDQRHAYIVEMKELRAEILARFHNEQAELLRDEHGAKARQHLMALMAVLKERGPNTERVRDLYHEAEAMMEELHLPSSAREPRVTGNDAGSEAESADSHDPESQHADQHKAA